MSCADLRVLFVAAAGPRRGFGHLVRCRSLARAMGIRPLIAIRGGSRVVDAALVIGCDVLPGSHPALVGKMAPDVLVVDDPITRTAAEWIAAGRRVDALVVSIHDLGIGCLDADLVVDGSIGRTARASRGRTLAGTSYAVLDPAIAITGSRETESPAADITNAADGSRARVLISLGGGPRAGRASSIADAVARHLPEASIRIIGGFMPGHGKQRNGRVTWVDAPRGLREELTNTDVAVLGGGISLYEACALGIPAVGVPVVRGQEATVAAFVARQAAVGVPDVAAAAEAIAGHAERLVRDGRLRHRVAATARQTVDGRGAGRVAAVIAAMNAERHTTRSLKHYRSQGTSDHAGARADF